MPIAEHLYKYVCQQLRSSNAVLDAAHICTCACRICTYAHVCTHACQRSQTSNAEPIAKHMCACTKEGSQGWMHQHLCSAQAVVLPPEAHTRQARAMDMLFCGNAQQLTGCALTMHVTCIQSDATRKKMRITCISGCSDKQEDAYNMHSG